MKVNLEKKLDRRRKYYLVLDCETATLPFASDYSADVKKTIAIAKPLIYDLGWQVIDNKGNVYKRRSFLISEIFSVPSIFNTAYYASKRPIYLEKMNKGTISLKSWREATEILEADLQEVCAVGAYNSMFDYKKALPFTELYINKLYSPDLQSWLDFQKSICNEIASGSRRASEKEFEADLFRFRGKSYKLFDLWGLSARHILNCNEYKNQCIENNWITESGKYFKTSAETTFRFITKNNNFDESHTAIEDAEIESKIFAKIYKQTKGKFEYAIIYFPFRELGRADCFIKI